MLHKEEELNDLALQKLTTRGICPACGTSQRSLQDIALKYAQEHKCTLCGSDEPQEESVQLSTLHGQLHDKVHAQKRLERNYLDVSSKLNLLTREEEELQYEVNKYWYDNSDVAQLERLETVSFDEDHHTQLKKLERQERQLELEIKKRKNALEKEYAEYQSKFNTRLSDLRNSYQEYAKKFLGVDCDLAERDIGKAIRIKQYIPKFNEIDRPSPDSCSEAQRFFLDIAFRMALIDFACAEGGDATSFICETPETALDVSYINNVVGMFQAFSNRGHSLFVSTNIQHDSIAGKLVNSSRDKGQKPTI